MAANVATTETFQIVTVYDGMSEEDKQELMEELAEVDGDAFPVRHIQVPNADTGKVYKVETEKDGEFDFVKTFDAIVLFRHYMNTRWAGEYGANNGENQLPLCSSMDGKTGHDRANPGAEIPCASCPYNQFTSDEDGKVSKECKNSMRIYLILSGKPDLYVLGVPASSLKSAANQLSRIMGASRMPLYKQVVRFSLQTATGKSSGRQFNAVTVEGTDMAAPEEMWGTLKTMKNEVISQYQSVGVQIEDASEAPAALKTDADGFVEIPPDDVSDENLPFN